MGRYIDRSGSLLLFEELMLSFANKTAKVLEDYLSLGYTPQELVEMDEVHFLEVYERTYKPITQIAINMGYDIWKSN